MTIVESCSKNMAADLGEFSRFERRYWKYGKGREVLECK